MPKKSFRLKFAEGAEVKSPMDYLFKKKLLLDRLRFHENDGALQLLPDRSER